MKGLRWRYTRLVRGPAWPGGPWGKVGGGEISGRLGPGPGLEEASGALITEFTLAEALGLSTTPLKLASQY